MLAPLRSLAAKTSPVPSGAHRGPWQPTEAGSSQQTATGQMLDGELAQFVTNKGTIVETRVSPPGN